VEVVTGPARAEAGFNKIVFAYALAAPPATFLDLLPLGGRLVVPLLTPDGSQRLTLFARDGDGLHRTEHGEVLYLCDRDERAATPEPR
jgi:protein-L-isoaspartate O-methyltransferase